MVDRDGIFVLKNEMSIIDLLNSVLWAIVSIGHQTRICYSAASATSGFMHYVDTANGIDMKICSGHIDGNVLAHNWRNLV